MDNQATKMTSLQNLNIKTLKHITTRNKLIPFLRTKDNKDFNTYQWKIYTFTPKSI